MSGLIELACSVMAVLLFSPFFPCLSRRGKCKCFPVDHYCCIFFCSHPVNEQVIITRWSMVDGRKALITVKKVLFIGKVPAYTHVGISCKRVSKVLQGSMKGFKPYGLIKPTRCFLVSAIAKCHLGTITES